MSVSTRTVIVISIVVCCVLFVAGILIGHFAIEKPSDDKGEKTSDNKGGDSEHLLDTRCEETTYTDEWGEYKDTYLKKCVEDTCRNGTCHTDDLPRTYLAYHLDGKTINIDGKLDDPAWEEVGWTETFMDIRGPNFPTPHFDTKVKVRWDDTRLYVGAHMQQTDFWGNIIHHDDGVWQQNAFEVYAVPDGSMHNYKELEINVLNTTFDLSMSKAYMDRRCDTKEQVANASWEGDIVKDIFTDGTVNDPNGKGTFWNVEWSFSFDALSIGTERSSSTPSVNESWFFIFARPEYPFKLVNGTYEKDDTKETSWWSWQPTYAVNLHLPTRFGLVQFKRDMQDTAFHYDKWHIYSALFETFDAEHEFKSVSGMFVSDIKLLDLAPKFLSSDCVTISVALTSDGDFEVSVKSILDASLPTGHIRGDRYIWFTYM